MNFTPWETNLIKMGYIYLFVLSIVCVGMAIWISSKFKTQTEENNKYMHFMVVSVMFLSIMQCYQCIVMIEGKLNAGWWIPFFCKHGALWVYIISMLLVSYKVDHPDNRLIKNQSEMVQDNVDCPLS